MYGGSEIYQILLFILAAIIYLTFFGFAIYKAQKGGKFFSVFNIIGIIRLYRKMGILQTIFLIIVGSISLNLIYSCVFDLGIFKSSRFLDFIVSFFINPIIFLFLTRLIALSGREGIPNNN